MAAARSQESHCNRSVNRSNAVMAGTIGTENTAAARSQVFHCKMSVNRSDSSHHRYGKYGSGQVSGVSL